MDIFTNYNSQLLTRMKTYPSLAVFVLLLICIHVKIAVCAPQQDFDLSSIGNADFIACLEANLLGEDCSGLVNPGPTEQPNCRCVAPHLCQDPKSAPVTAVTPSPGTNGGSFLENINVRNVLGSSCKGAFEICCVDIDLTIPNPVTPEPLPPTPDGGLTCGQLNPSGVDTAFAGFNDKQAQYGQFPWMAVVLTNGNGGTPNYLSGASIVHPRVVLTAAHYVNTRNPSELVVRVGEWDFGVDTEPYRFEDIAVQRIALHPQYNAQLLEYDVALLFLESDVPSNIPTVGLVCLPSPGEEFDEDACFVSGWGKDQFNSDGQYQQILKSVRLPTVQKSQCQSNLRTTRLGTTFNLHSSFMCAGGQGEDACTGDGGSPLVCPMKSDRTRYAQVGIVAWGIGCGTIGIPGVYADVAQAVDWIGQELLSVFRFDIRTGFSK